jgi:hypothetical protein
MPGDGVELFRGSRERLDKSFSPALSEYACAAGRIKTKMQSGTRTV